jgi:hypothetical protein
MPEPATEKSRIHYGRGAGIGNRLREPSPPRARVLRPVGSKRRRREDLAADIRRRPRRGSGSPGDVRDADSVPRY